MKPSFALALILCLASSRAWAQGDLTRIYPNGARQGTRLKLTLGGENIPETADLLVDGDGIRAVGPFTKGEGEVEIAADAAPGVRQVRLAGPKGGTTPRPFAIGALAEAQEKEPNNRADQAEPVPQFPIVLNGTLPTRGDIDVFRVSLKKDQCLVAAGESRALGAPTNLLVRIRDTAGREFLVQMDYRTRDPLLGFTAPADGEYLVELQEVMNNYSNLSADYVYRLTLTTGPWLDSVFPAGAQQGATARLTFSGWNLGGQSGPSRLEATVVIPPDASRRYPVSAGGAPNQVPLLTSSALNLVEDTLRSPSPASPPHNPTTPPAVTPPVVINGTLGERGEIDAYRFSARAGETLMLDVDARESGSFADPVMVLLDGTGKVISTVDDAEGTRDPKLLWTAPAEGTYTVRIRDVAPGSRGGPGFFYRLSIAPPEPVLRLTTDAPALTLKPGTKLEVPLSVRQSYQSGEVTIRVEGLPPGVTAAPLTVPGAGARTSTTQVKLALTAAPDVKPGSALLRLVAVTGGERPITAAATASWVLSKDRSGTLATGSTERLLLLIPAP